MSCPRGNLRHNPAFFNISRIEGDRREDGFSGMNIPEVDFRNKKKKNLTVSIIVWSRRGAFHEKTRDETL